MTFLRLRVLRSSVVGACFLRWGRTHPPRPPPPGTRRRRRRSPPTPCRSRCRSIRRSSSARCRTACATTCARTAKPAHRAELRLVVKAGSVLEDDDQQGLAHFVEHMEFEGTRHFPGQSIVDFLSSLGLSIGAGRERGDELRRHAVHAAGADRRARRARPRAARPRGLGAGARRSIRAASTASAASSSRNGGCTSAPASARSDKIRRVQLEGSRYADRPPIGKPDIIEHAQREQLMRFYRDWYRPDLMAVIVVGDVDRDAVGDDDQGAFLAALPAPSPAAAAAGIRRARSSRHALRRRHRQGNDRDRRRGQRPAAGAQPGLGRRLSRADARPAVRRHARRAARRARPEREPAVPAGGARIAGCSRRRGRRTKRSSRRSSRTTASTRGLDALVTELQRVARFGFTATELDRAKQAMMRGYERVVDGKPGPRVGEPRRRVHAQLPPGRGAADDLAGARVPPPLRPGDHAGRGQRARRATGSPTATGSSSCPRRKRPASSCPIEAQLAAVVKAASAKRLEPYVDAAAGQTLMDAPPARGTIVKTTTTAGGRDHRVDAVERRHGRAQADDAEGGPDPVPRRRRRAARRSRATPTSFPPASPTPSSPPAASGGSAP